jgi:hypothetical protein
MTKVADLKLDPLYRELGEIGRTANPADPANLVGRAELLSCLSVTTRAGQDVAPEQLAYAASHAIRAAVRRVTPKRDRYIAEATFGLGGFEGDIIDQRLRTLHASSAKISPHTYWKQRPVVLEQIMYHLRTELLDDLVVPDEADEHHLEVLTYLTSAAFHLHWALRGLFLSHDLTIPGRFEAIPESDRAKASHWSAAYANPKSAIDYSFDCFLTFLLSIYDCYRLVHRYPLDPYSPVEAFNRLLTHEALSPYVSTNVATSLPLEARAALETGTPFSLDQCAALSTRAARAPRIVSLRRDTLKDALAEWREWCDGEYRTDLPSCQRPTLGALALAIDHIGSDLNECQDRAGVSISCAAAQDAALAEVLKPIVPEDRFNQLRREFDALCRFYP